MECVLILNFIACSKDNLTGSVGLLGIGGNSRAGLARRAPRRRKRLRKLEQMSVQGGHSSVGYISDSGVSKKQARAGMERLLCGSCFAEKEAPRCWSPPASVSILHIAVASQCLRVLESECLRVRGRVRLQHTSTPE